MATPESTRTYATIGVVLAVLTALEFGILFAPALKPVAILLLVILALAKFTLVVAYFMHIRFERRVLAWVFSAGVLLSLAVWYGTWAIFYYRIPSTLP